MWNNTNVSAINRDFHMVSFLLGKNGDRVSQLISEKMLVLLHKKLGFVGLSGNHDLIRFRIAMRSGIPGQSLNSRHEPCDSPVIGL